MPENTQRAHTKRILFRWVKLFILVYCSLGLAVYYLQDYLILHPVKIPAGTKFSFTMPFTEVNIPYDQNTNINLVEFAATDNLRGIILYFHGNKSNIERYAPFVPALTKRGYEVWMIDYPGFGKSTGEFSENLAYEWAMIEYKLALKRFPPDSIIIYGRSLGTGIASQLASVRDCKRLILETPYYSMTSMANRFCWMYPNRIFKYNFPTNLYLKKVTAPVTFFHGTNDGVIPYSNAEKLKECLKAGDEFITISGGTHNNLNDDPQMKRKLDSLLR